jgi:hypothetical protein
VDPITLGALISALFAAGGQVFGAAAQGSAANRATASNERLKQQELDFLRQSALLNFDAQENENERRTGEAQFRAAKLEDIVKLFQGLEGPAGLGEDADRLRGMASQMMEGGWEGDLRKAAMGELGRNSGALNAMLAQSGVLGSGFAAGQQRGLAADTMMGLARDIAAQRGQNMGMAGNFLGQAGQLSSLLGNFDLNRLNSIGSIYQDEAFGANMPYRRAERPVF